MTISLSNYALCRLSVAFIWIYQGIFPKLLGPHSDEIAMSMAFGLTRADAERVAFGGGISEVIFGLLILILWSHRWPLLLSAISMVGLLAFALAATPELAKAAFNPVISNVCIMALAIVGYRLHSQKSNR